MRNRYFALLLAICSFAAGAQEGLDAILERGYVAHWLVCGPFKSGQEGGIAGALARGEAALGATDFMAPAGGAARVRPKHGMSVSAPEGGTALWQRAGATDATLDLAPFFPDVNEGVAYAAFFAQTARDQSVYFDIQTPLGARIYLNGFRLRNIRNAPLAANGVDRFVLDLRRGLNLVLLEVPGITFEALADALGRSVDSVRFDMLQHRTLLSGNSGFEIAVALHAVDKVGSVYYVPGLSTAGVFRGRGAALEQEVALTLFNNEDRPSSRVDVELRVAGTTGAINVAVPPVPPKTPLRVPVAVPVGRRAAGDTMAVEVTLRNEGETVRFTQTIRTQGVRDAGQVYFVTGRRQPGLSGNDQAAMTDDSHAAFEREMRLAAQEPGFGFYLGGVPQWKSFLAARPEWATQMRELVLQGRCAPQAGYTTLDERLVSGELLVRNLAYGHHAAKRILGETGGAFYSWDTPAICPQTPQLLDKIGAKGIISNLETPGVPAIAWQLSPDGSDLLHRRKRFTGGPATIGALTSMAELQRREMAERGLDTDLLADFSAFESPQPFLVGECARLKASFPSILVSGAGGGFVLEEAAAAVRRDAADVPASARLLNRVRMGELLAWPGLKQAYARTNELVLAAEKTATAAALLGAEYPAETLDKAWRQLLFYGAPDRLGFPDSARNGLDALAGCREVADLASGVQARAMAYIAQRANTYENVPADTQGIQPIVVFNPCSWDRTDVCVVDIEARESGGAVLDDKGRVLSAAVETRFGSRTARRVTFIAEDVPSLGYRTVYFRPAKDAPAPRTVAGAEIQNEFWRVIADPEAGGDIVSIRDRATGKEYLAGNTNSVLVFSEDTSKNDGGRELWTSGLLARTGGDPAETKVTRTLAFQRLSSTVPLAGGHLTRTITLYKGVKRIECETTLEGVLAPDRMAAVAFRPKHEGLAPVFGERFGAVTGRRSYHTLEFRTGARDGYAGAGLQPAYGWGALSPNDHIEAGLDTVLPLAPCAVVHGESPALAREADAIQRALAKRGIPAWVTPDTPPRPGALWSDSTEWPNLNDDLDYGTAMRIVVGSPEQNLEAGRLVTQMNEKAVARFTERLTDGVRMLVPDADVPNGKAPVPTLLIAGQTVDQTAREARAFAEKVAIDGIYAIAPADSFVEPPGEQVTGGLAVLTQGGALASVEQDGTLVLGLAHGAEWPHDPGGLDLPQAPKAATFRYAIEPFEGTWRAAGVPRAAEAYRQQLAGAATDLHHAEAPPAQSFARPLNPDFIVSAFKPAGFDTAAMSASRPDPRAGYILRGYESSGMQWTSSLQLPTGILSATFASPAETPAASIPAEEDLLLFRADGFSVQTLRISPQPAVRRGEPVSLAPEQEGRSIFSRYWLHNAGAAPAGMNPVSLLLESDVGTGGSSATVTVANNLTDAPLAGTVYITATLGWRVSPGSFSYDLNAGGFAKQELLVLRQNSAGGGGLAATTFVAGKTWRDVFSLDEDPLELEVEVSGAEVRVRVRNNGGLAAEGNIDAIAPPEYWPELGHGDVPAVVPGRAPVYVPPYEEQRLLFRVRAAGPPPWLVLKLSANGLVTYHRVQF